MNICVLTHDCIVSEFFIPVIIRALKEQRFDFVRDISA